MFDFFCVWVLIGCVFIVMVEMFMFIKCFKLVGFNFYKLLLLVFIYVVLLIISIVLFFGGLWWVIVMVFKFWYIYGLCWKWFLIVWKFFFFLIDKKYLIFIWIENYLIFVLSLWMVYIVDVIIVLFCIYFGIRDVGNLNVCVEFVYLYCVVILEFEFKRFDLFYFVYY